MDMGDSRNRKEGGSLTTLGLNRTVRLLPTNKLTRTLEQVKPKLVTKPYSRTTKKLSTRTLSQPMLQTRTKNMPIRKSDPPRQNSSINESIRKIRSNGSTNMDRYSPPNAPPSVSVSFDCDPKKGIGIQDNLNELCDEQYDSVRKRIIEVITELLDIVFKELFAQPIILRDPIRFLITLFREIVINTMIDLLDVKKHSKLIKFLKGVTIMKNKYKNRSLRMIVSQRLVTTTLAEKGIRSMDQTFIKEFNTVFSDKNRKYLNQFKKKIKQQMPTFITFWVSVRQTIHIPTEVQRI